PAAGRTRLRPVLRAAAAGGPGQGVPAPTTTGRPAAVARRTHRPVGRPQRGGRGDGGRGTGDGTDRGAGGAPSRPAGPGHPGPDDPRRGGPVNRSTPLGLALRSRRLLLAVFTAAGADLAAL